MAEFEIRQDIRDRFLDPSERAHGAFWFWNGELDPVRICQQLHEMRDKGIGSVYIHARLFLPESIGYLTERWFHMVRVAVEEAGRIGMAIWLYDEGMYPSGSANGLVVANDPDLKCKGLVCEAFRVDGECGGCDLPIWIGPGEKLVAIVSARIDKDALCADSFQDLTGMVSGDSLTWRCDPGLWQVMVFRQRFQNSAMRGMGHGPVPYAADILSPAATESFISLTHERYFRWLQDHFGTTIRGFFTDEPSPTGRGGIVGAIPWTDKFCEEFESRKGYDLRPWLPALFYETPGRDSNVRWDYEEVLSELLDASFFVPLQRWCRNHGVLLTGHPAGFGELRHLRTFDMPGQDVVWRQVTPDNPTPVLGKIASSAAHIYGKPNAAAEVYGAYGWELSPSEMKWLADWLLVRGVDTHILHAAYYSLEGANKFERPPDVCMGSPWWKHFRLFSDYVSRVAQIVRSGRHVADIAVLDQCNQTKEDVPHLLLSIQRDFDFLESRVFTDEAEIANGALKVQDEQYRILVLPDMRRTTLKVMRRIEEFAAAGGKVLAVGAPPSLAAEHGCDWEVQKIARRIRARTGNARTVKNTRESMAAVLDEWLEADIRVRPPNPDLRYLHRKTESEDLYLLVNESIKHEIKAEITFRDGRLPEIWDGESGRREPAKCFVQDTGRTVLPIRLSPYQSLIVAFGTGSVRGADGAPHVTSTTLDIVTDVRRYNGSILVCGLATGSAVSAEGRYDGRICTGAGRSQPAPESIDLSRGWRLVDQGLVLPELVSWTELPGLRYWSGTCRYAASFELPEEYIHRTVRLVLDLGEVREAAELLVNGENVAVRLWPPFRFDVTGFLRPGRNTVEVLVTNTPANEYEQMDIPSGLLGPVTLKAYRTVELMLSEELRPAPVGGETA